MTSEPSDRLKIIAHKNYLIAMEGVLIRGDQIIPGADRFVRRLRERDANCLLLTNNSRYTPQDLAGRLNRMGLPVRAGNIFTSAMATARYLHSQKPGGSAFVIGENGLKSALQEVNYVFTDQNPDYVVLGGTDDYNFELLTKAINLIIAGALFICTNPDRTGRAEKGLVPASGSMAILIETATGAAPFFIGKPNPIMTRYALNHLGVHSEDTILIGDQMETDIIAGLESGVETVLVLSGDLEREQLARFAYQPKYIIHSVAELYPE
jgi:NagD protein